MDIKARLQAHYNAAAAHYGEANILGVFLYGSQNYKTSIDTSDVDTKCILLPDLFHLAIENYPVKDLMVDDEKCTCMTIMHAVANWKKQNINFVEILFTPFHIINPRYKRLWSKLMTPTFKEEIGRYDVAQTICSMGHQALSHLKMPTNKAKMNALRVYTSLSLLLTDIPYWGCIHFTPETAAHLLEYRNRGMSDHTVEHLRKRLESLIENAEDYAATQEDKERINVKLNNLIIQLLQKRAKYRG